MSGMDNENSWLWMPNGQIEELMSRNGTWPFTNISTADFLQVLNSFDKNLANSTMQIYGSLVGALGILWTALLIGSLWRQTFTNKNSFYRGMMVVAMANLVFNILSLIFNIWFTMYKIKGCANHTSMWIMVGMRGLVFMWSLISDLCTVVLTFERLLSVLKPHLHQFLFEMNQKLTHVILGLTILLVSATRLHYSIDITVVTDGIIYFYTESTMATSVLVIAMTMISDTILPMLLLVIMLVLSSLFRIAVMKREKKRIEKLKLTRRLTNAGSAIMPTNFGPSRAQDVSPGPGTPRTPVNKEPAMNYARRQSRIAPVEVEPRRDSVRRPSSIHLGKLRESNNHDHRSMMVLTLTLDALFLLNQVGYCVYWAFVFLQETGSFSFDSTKEDLVQWIKINRGLNYADIGVSLSECLSHALNFPLYVALSGSMRQEFSGFFKRAIHVLLKR